MPNNPLNPDEPNDPHEENSAAQDPQAESGRGGDGNRKPPRVAASDDDDDRVGYKRPPKKHRFPPGQSGNPRGRSKGAKGLKTILKKELGGRVRITENGKTRSISKMELLIKRLVEKGGKGDYKSLAKLLDLGALVFGMDDEDGNESVLTRQEQAIIDEAAKRRRELSGKTRKRRTGTSRKRTALQKKDDSNGDSK